MTPDITPDERPFWTYADLLVFIGLAFPSLLVAFLMARVLGHVPGAGKAFTGLLGQLLWYILIFGSLFALFKLRYERPFWRSLGWKFPFRGAGLCLLSGPFMALGVGALGYAIHTPIIKLPMFDQMLSDRPTIVLFCIFVVLLGPLCEELAFRGFLMPLLMRSFGVVAGIAGSALLFGGLHAFEYQWSWRHVLLISTVGGILGWVRHAAGSTAASTFLHSTYNLTQLAVFLAQKQ